MPDGKSLLSLCCIDTGLWPYAHLLGILWGKNLLLERRLEHVCRRSTREKLLAYLSDQARIHQSLEFDIPLNRQELADYLCVDRSAMSSELGKMRDEGILEFRREHFVMRGEERN